ncbi:MAG: radical SAM protein [Candidatus Omnitrophota bacterium]
MPILPLNHAWFFVTDRCNLRCGYCFFKHKTGRSVMTEKTFRAAMDFTGTFKRPEFIFSGGEPLLVWPKVRGWIRKIRMAYPKDYISVQSNVTLLDQRKSIFLKENDVNVEVGIDGDEKTMCTNRPGAGEDYYRGVCRAIGLLTTSGGRSTATMTVYPQGAGQLLSNLKHLDGLGARRIEIHPAFMEAWNISAAKKFLQGYRQASVYALKENKRGLIGRGYSEVPRGAWDMVVLPDGKVLPNWTFLSFPEAVRKDFYVMDLSGGTVRMLPAADGYFSALQKFIVSMGKKGATYRQISNFNAGLAIRKADVQPMERFLVYAGLCDDVERIDQEILRKVLC